MKRVVYTCLFGHSELFNDFEYQRDDIDFICFTDDPELRSDFWEIRLLPKQLLDPARAAKKLKALPHIYLAEYDWSLYIDNTVRLKVAPSRLFDEYLATARSPLVCFRHYERDCIYDEAEVVLLLDFDTPARVIPQMEFYRYLGYPAHAGLGKSTLLLRRHHDPGLQRAMNFWSDQIQSRSKRDQLSMMPSCWSVNFAIEFIPERFDKFELLEWPVLKQGLRLPRDFDEVCYLHLNPDLATIGMDLRKHFLLQGQGEGRKYKKSDMAAIARAWTNILRRIARRLSPRNSI